MFSPINDPENRRKLEDCLLLLMNDKNDFFLGDAGIWCLRTATGFVACELHTSEWHDPLSVPSEPEGAFLTEKLMKRLIFDRKTYATHRARRERVVARRSEMARRKA